MHSAGFHEMSARTRVPVAPKVMRWARVSSGATVAEAAHRIDQDPAVIEAWENGRGDPTIGALEQLAVLYDRPLAVFLLDEPWTIRTSRSTFAQVRGQARARSHGRRF